MLLAPLCVSGPVPEPRTFPLPMVHSGDEPHYLVLINSVLGDGDFDLANNYADVHAGGVQAGRKFAGWPLDHHVTWYWHDHCKHWWEAYEMEPERWNKDAQGHPVPTLRTDSIHRPVSAREYSQHSPGLAVLLAPALFPFRGTALVEPAALFATALATVAGFLAFCWLVGPYVAHAWQTVLIGAVAYLGSPLWHYGRTLFVEPFAATLVIAAYAAVLRANGYLLGGVLLGAVVLLKAPFAILAAPLIVETVWRKEWSSALRVGVPVLAAVGISLWWNKQMRNGWLHAPQRWEWAPPLEGFIGLLFSWKHGILMAAPALLVAACCVRQWFRLHCRDAALISAAVAVYFGLMGCYAQWWGGWCYSARYLVPVLPLMFAPLAMLGHLGAWKADRRVRCAGMALMGVSVVFGAIAAFACERVWGTHPACLAFSW